MPRVAQAATARSRLSGHSGGPQGPRERTSPISRSYGPHSISPLFSGPCSSSRDTPRRKGNNQFIPESQAPGTDNIQRCGCGLHLVGVGAAGPYSEGPVQGGDAGELQEPGLPGASVVQTICDMPAGGRGRALCVGERNLSRSPLRLGEKV
ncbi:zinc finger protein 514 isoform 2-T2 [Trichechus inunguis]